MSVVLISSDQLPDLPEYHREGGAREPGSDQRPEIPVPLGLISLASVLKSRRRRDVRIEALPPTHSRRAGHVVGDGIDRILAAERLDWVGLSTRCDTYATSLQVAREIKRLRPDLPVVLGGPQATATAIATLKAFPFVDAIVRGEAENVIHDLDDALGGRGPISQVPSLVYRDGPEVRATPVSDLPVDLDALPDPDYSLVPWLSLASALPIDAGRGCPFQCTYCSTNRFFSSRYRLRSEDGLIALIERTIRTTGVRRIQFTHDNLTANARKFDRFCARLKDAALDIDWSCSSRLDCLDADRLAQMRDAGCVAVFIGLETGSPRMQKVIRKNLDLRIVEPRLREVVDRIPGFATSFMMGFPTETLIDLSETADVMSAVREVTSGQETVQLHMLSPTPGTPLFERWTSNLRLPTTDEMMAEEAPFDDFVRLDLDPVVCDWVRTYPNLFGNHYYVQSEILSRTVQIAVYTTLTVLHRNFPNTARLMHSQWLPGDRGIGLPVLAAVTMAGQWDDEPWPAADGTAHVASALIDVLAGAGSLRASRALDVLRVEQAIRAVRGGHRRSATVDVGWDVAEWLRTGGSRDDAWSAPVSPLSVLIATRAGDTPLIARIPSGLEPLLTATSAAAGEGPESRSGQEPQLHGSVR